MINNKQYYLLVCAAVLVAGVVILMGAYTRLTNAGLGCPDWPGCYGHLVLPQTQSGLQNAQSVYPQVPIVTKSAWTEMVHRYAAGTLVLLILGIFAATLLRFKTPEQPRVIPFILICLVAFQALLGMFTVTLKLLPIVVMGHLLGGMLTCTALWLLQLQLNPLAKFSLPYQAIVLRPWAVLGLTLVLCQIALGGWVSSNYAGLACIGFPECNGKLIPNLNFSHAFNFFSSIGANYQGGVLDSASRVTIQYIHRLGAVVTASYLGGLSIIILAISNKSALQNIAVAILGLVVIQFTLGVINVTHLLPLPVAVAHNGVAVLLLLAVTTLNYVLFSNREALL